MCSRMRQQANQAKEIELGDVLMIVMKRTDQSVNESTRPIELCIIELEMNEEVSGALLPEPYIGIVPQQGQDYTRSEW